MYFDYNSYQLLRDISTVDQMQIFLDQRGFESVLASNDPQWIADGLAEAVEDRTPPWWATIDIITLIVLPLWLLTRIPKRSRVFPRKSIESMCEK